MRKKVNSKKEFNKKILAVKIIAVFFILGFALYFFGFRQAGINKTGFAYKTDGAAVAAYSTLTIYTKCFGSETLVPNVDVQVYLYFPIPSNPSYNYNVIKKSDSSGVVNFIGLLPGSYKAGVVGASPFRELGILTGHNTARVDTTACSGGTPPSGKLYLNIYGSYYYANRLNDVYVNIYKDGILFEKGKTPKNEEFKFNYVTELPQGIYSVSLIKNGYLPRSFGPIHFISDASYWIEMRKPSSSEVDSGRTFKINVIDKDTFEQIEGVAVQLTQDSFDKTGYTTRLAENYNLVFSNISTNSYEYFLRARLSSYMPFNKTIQWVDNEIPHVVPLEKIGRWDKTGGIFGKVYNKETGKLIQGAEISFILGRNTLYKTLTNDRTELWNYAQQNLPVANIHVLIKKDGYRELMSSVAVIADRLKRYDFALEKIELSEAYRIEGVVLNMDGKPVENAVVYFENADEPRNPEDQTFTDKQGKFSKTYITRVDGFSKRINIRAYLMEASAHYSGNPITLQQGQAKYVILYLAPYEWATHFVLHVEDKETGAPIDNAEIAVFKDSQRLKPLPKIVNLRNGEYLIVPNDYVQDMFKPGDYVFKVSARNYNPGEGRIIVSSFERGSGTGLYVQLTKTSDTDTSSQLSNVVVHVSDYETKEPLSAYVTFEKQGGNRETIRDKTNDLGFLTLQDVTFGNYLIKVYAPGYKQDENSFLRTRILSREEEFKFRLVRFDNSAYNLYGSVYGYNASSKEYVPLNGARVVITKIGTLKKFASYSDENGHVEFTNIPSGSYKLNAYKDGYYHYVATEITYIRELKTQFWITMLKIGGQQGEQQSGERGIILYSLRDLISDEPIQGATVLHTNLQNDILYDKEKSNDNGKALLKVPVPPANQILDIQCDKCMGSRWSIKVKKGFQEEEISVCTYNDNFINYHSKGVYHIVIGPESEEFATQNAQYYIDLVNLIKDLKDKTKFQTPLIFVLADSSFYSAYAPYQTCYDEADAMIIFLLPLLLYDKSISEEIPKATIAHEFGHHVGFVKEDKQWGNLFRAAQLSSTCPFDIITDLNYDYGGIGGHPWDNQDEYFASFFSAYFMQGRHLELYNRINRLPEGDCKNTLMFTWSWFSRNIGIFKTGDENKFPKIKPKADGKPYEPEEIRKGSWK